MLFAFRNLLLIAKKSLSFFEDEITVEVIKTHIINCIFERTVIITILPFMIRLERSGSIDYRIPWRILM